MRSVYLLILVMLLLVSQHGVAQDIHIQKKVVTGKIIDINGLPIIGAKISVNGTTKNTTTNFDGKFSLEIENENTIYINYVDFKPIEVIVNPQTNITFLLQETNSTKTQTNLTRKEMRKIRKSQNKQPDKGIGSNTVENLFYILKAVAD
ncbi:carboxypeptidase-like regulatory domain-containing protein [Flavobacteriaceae bacterium MJ-SS4]|uniref:carboxypeptidase-like regulatory domain-containing protein n=1 Tax=Gilvirhabdus luticola TaxID=3079858 RepID=UPI0032DD5993